MNLDAYISRFRSTAKTSGFVLDFDGTLSAIVEEPSAAEPLPGVPALLERLAARYAVTAVLTGRQAEPIRQIIGAHGVVYYGIYGAEILTEDGLSHPPEADRWRSMASRLARDAEVLIATEGLEGCEVEYKDLAVSLHFRRAADDSFGEVLASWAETAAPRRGFVASGGRKVVELRPEGVSKAGTLGRIVQGSSMTNLVSAGDDAADAATFAAAIRLVGEGALTIAVASAESPASLLEAARVTVASPEELVALLERFAAP